MVPKHAVCKPSTIQRVGIGIKAECQGLRTVERKGVKGALSDGAPQFEDKGGSVGSLWNQREK